MHRPILLLARCPFYETILRIGYACTWTGLSCYEPDVLSTRPFLESDVFVHEPAYLAVNRMSFLRDRTCFHWLGLVLNVCACVSGSDGISWDYSRKLRPLRPLQWYWDLEVSRTSPPQRFRYLPQHGVKLWMWRGWHQYEVSVFANGIWGFVSWWRHQMEAFSALLAICAGNSPVTGEFPAQRPVRQSFDVFFDLRMNKRLSQESWGWWFETPSPSRSLWRHSNLCGG